MPAPLECASCHEAFTAGSIRTINVYGLVTYICRTCFLKLSEKDRRNRKREPKLPEEVIYSQDELPF